VVNTGVSAQPVNPINLGQIGCAETLVKYYYYPLRNNQKERSSQLIILGFFTFLISVRNVLASMKTSDGTACAVTAKHHLRMIYKLY
jgi:hypothetical protein